MNNLMEQITAVAPKHYNFLMKTAAEVNDSPFRKDILEELDVLVKKAFTMPSWMGSAAKGVGKTLGAGALGVAGAATAGIAYALAGDMYDAVKRGISKTRNYQNMIEANPELKRMPAKDVQKAFSVLHRLNPEFSSDPTISGAWVKRQASFGDDTFGDVGTLKQLIDSRKSLTDLRRLPAVPQFPGRKDRPSISKKDLEEQVGVLQNDLGAYSNQINNRFQKWEDMLTVAPASKSGRGSPR